MQALLTTFGIDWRLLLVNAINFGILLFGLRYFLYKPLTEMLERRREAVLQSVHDATAAKERLAEVESSRAALLSAASKDADEVRTAARIAAERAHREAVSSAEVAAVAILKGAEAEGEEIKKKSLEESKQEVAKLIVLGMEKIRN